MESYKVDWSLLSFKEQANWLSPNPPTYQREKGGIWKVWQEQLLIDSVLRSIDIPKIYLRKVSTTPLEYEVVDGQQRIHALLRFLRDEFSLDENANDLHFNGNIYLLASKKYSQLDELVRTQLIHTYNLTVVIISNATEDEVADLFYRLNNGRPLNAAEVRNSMPGQVTKFVRRLPSILSFRSAVSRKQEEATTRWQRKCFAWNSMAARKI